MIEFRLVPWYFPPIDLKIRRKFGQRNKPWRARIRQGLSFESVQKNKILKRSCIDRI